MSTKTIEQLAALTEIRRLAEKHFPDIEFERAWEWQLIDEITFEDKQTWSYNALTEAYELVVKPECKVCGEDEDDVDLLEVPTHNGSKFYICDDCKREIASKTVEKVS